MDDSVIICTDLSPLNGSKNSRILRNGKTKIKCTEIQITPKRPVLYESPLKHFNQRLLSVTHWTEAGCTPCTLTKTGRLLGVNKANENILEDSVIVLSDNETTTNNTTSRRSIRKLKRKRSSSQSDSFCLLISDSEDQDSPQGLQNLLTNNNKKLSQQSNDDIEVLWSSTEIADDNTPLFIIDKNANTGNLDILNERNSTVTSATKKSKTQHITKKRKVNNTGTTVTKSKPLKSSQPCSTKGKNAQKHPVQINKKKRKKDNKKHENANSKNTTEKNIINQSENDSKHPAGTLREIIIDGCNVATTQVKGKTFSEIRLKLVIDYFKKRGHCVRAFVPQHKRSCTRLLLEQLHVDGTVVFTPSRQLEGKFITPYDDRLILEYATLSGGIVVSSDQYRDLYNEKPEWRDTIKNRLLQPTFVGDCVLFPEDPLGRHGPKLDQFLRH